MRTLVTCLCMGAILGTAFYAFGIGGEAEQYVAGEEGEAAVDYGSKVGPMWALASLSLVLAQFLKYGFGYVPLVDRVPIPIIVQLICAGLTISAYFANQLSGDLFELIGASLLCGLAAVGGHSSLSNIRETPEKLMKELKEVKLKTGGVKP